jgi:hypothetical protein
MSPTYRVGESAQDLEMSRHQAALETASIYHVVGTRATGEKVKLSEHRDQSVAEKFVFLIASTGNYSEIHIECDGLPAPGDGWAS